MEIERKFLVSRNFIFPRVVPDTIEQVYLSRGKNTTRVRLLNGRQYVMTIKSKGLLARQEVEFDLSHEHGKLLFEMGNGRISKDRYRVTDNDGNVIEIDEFKGALEGLVLAEVEFDSVEAAEAFIPYDWMIVEVTECPQFSNSNLAMIGVK